MSDIETFKLLKNNVAAAKQHREDFKELGEPRWLASNYFVLNVSLPFAAIALIALFLEAFGIALASLLAIPALLMASIVYESHKSISLFSEFAKKFPEEQAWIDADDGK